MCQRWLTTFSLVAFVQLCCCGQQSCSELSDEFADLEFNRTFVADDGFWVEYYSSQRLSSCAQSWILVPGVNLWANWTKILVVLGGMIYIFIGISVIADIFMSAVEVITSQKRTVIDSDGNEIIVRIWNPTIANLSLLALGSSCPEILLNVIETVQSLGESPGELGPGTIVGSAAFNLLIISAVCIVVVGPDCKRITDVGVFYITAVWSVLVYGWMFIVLEVWTPQVVSIAEAGLTLGAFVVFLLMAYLQDRDCLCCCIASKQAQEESNDNGGLRRTESIQVEAHFKRQQSPSKDQKVDKKQLKGILKLYKVGKLANKTSAAVIKSLAALKVFDDKRKRNDPMFHKINARKQLAGRKHYALTQRRYESMRDQSTSGIVRDPISYYSQRLQQLSFTDAQIPTVEFTSKEFRQLESSGHVQLSVKRSGAMNETLLVDYSTTDGSAVNGQDYQAARGTIIFKPLHETATFKIQIQNREGVQDDRFFNAILENPRVEGPTLTNGESGDGHETPSTSSTKHGTKSLVRLGQMSSTQVVIMDVDEVGFIGFELKQYLVTENAETVQLKLLRDYGACGSVSVEYLTMDGSGVKGMDYVEMVGKVEFSDGQTEAFISVQLLENPVAEAERVFYVSLSNASGGAQLTPRSLASVKIVEDGSLEELQNQVNNALRNKASVLYHTNDSWAQQFVDALSPGGGVDEQGEETNPTNLELILHFFGMFWKLLFATVPPTSYYNGWLTFLVSLIYIGILTAVVAEFAELFGCYTGLNDAVTAITFVALGTSLPDTFASMQAATSADDADAAIGNVTGSNTVNVLLGLGLPWLIGAIYYRMKFADEPNVNGRFCVPSGNLAYSVMIFTVCALLALGILSFRRKYLGGELGGHKSWKFFTAFVLLFLWISYITLTALQSYGHISFLDQDTNLDKFGCHIH